MLTQLHNAEWPHWPQSVRMIRADWNRFRDDKFRQCFLATDSGEPVAIGMASEGYWYDEPCPMRLEIWAKQDVADDRIVEIADLLEETACQFGSPIWQTEVLDLYPRRGEFWQAHGFEEKMRGWVSRCDVLKVDRSKFTSQLEAAQSHGLKIKSLAEMKEEGADFWPALHDLKWEIIQDVPHNRPPKQETLERFKEVWGDEVIVPPDSAFIGFVGDEMVGMSTGFIMEAQPDRFDTGLTGVARKHRRKGFATAMKLHVVDWCAKNGVRWIDTGNEKDNPMYQLNVALGFEQFCAWAIMEREAHKC